MDKLRKLREELERVKRETDSTIVAMRGTAMREIIKTMFEFDIKIADLVLALDLPSVRGLTRMRQAARRGELIQLHPDRRENK